MLNTHNTHKALYLVPVLTLILSGCAYGVSTQSTQPLDTAKKPYDDFVCVGLHHRGKVDEVLHVRLDVNHRYLEVNLKKYPIDFYTTDGHQVIAYTKNFKGEDGHIYYDAFIASKQGYQITQYAASPERYLMGADLICHSEKGSK